jgi:hypothetical protein
VALLVKRAAGIQNNLEESVISKTIPEQGFRAFISCKEVANGDQGCRGDIRVLSALRWFLQIILKKG